ncbi:TetR family transcriptional regulator [Streptomyces sp. NPDC050560]|uniref:TetR family transcriptional regulator n=1 Tax=Streptomyces sp. NPDC050560 TaxID=3365630 RepID=UPI0037A985B2
MPRDSRATKARLLKAATGEFAAHGIAGARVDRIAESAGCNKNLIYVHFGSKEGLFDAVFAVAVGELLTTVPIDADDLPGYAGALHDFYRAHPEHMRLARWHSLERPGAAALLPVVVESGAAKLKAIAAAQADGRVDAGLPPHALLALLLSLSATWSAGSPEAMGQDGADGGEGEDAEALAALRHAVVVAAGRLTRPRTADS